MLVHEQIKDKGVLVLYSGLVSQHVIESMSTRIRSTSTDNGSVPRTLLAMFVELAQNILHHGAHAGHLPASKAAAVDSLQSHQPTNPATCDDLAKTSQQRSRPGTLVIGVKQGQHYIVSSSLILKEHRQKLMQTLEHLRQSTPSQLQETYRQQRQQTSQLPGNQAGLGLMWVARKASAPLTYRFTECEESETCLFTLKVCV